MEYLSSSTHYSKQAYAQATQLKHIHMKSIGLYKKGSKLDLGNVLSRLT
jgi:hypothetical protein